MNFWRRWRGPWVKMPDFSLYSNGQKIEDKIFLRNFAAEEVGIFESMRTYNGRIFREEEHLERLVESAQTSGFPRPDLKKIRRELKLALAVFQQDVFIRLTLWRDQIFVMVGSRSHPGSFYERGVALRTSPVRKNLTHASAPEAKTSDYQNAILATLEPSSGGTYEWLFLDSNGFVTEVRIGNLFMIKDGVLRTPPARGILNGVTRRFVIECAPQAGMEVEETPLTRHDVFNAEEAFLTNTSWEILPVSELDGRRIGQKVPGPGTQKLHRVFRQNILKECPSKPFTEPSSAFPTKRG